MGFIYQCTNLINNKIYIGQTTRSLKERKAEYVHKAINDGTYFHNALLEWYKDGGGCGFSIACHTSTEFYNIAEILLKLWRKFVNTFLDEGKASPTLFKRKTFLDWAA